MNAETQRLIEYLALLRDIKDLYGSPLGQSVLRMIEHAAKTDLPGIVRIWQDHAPSTLQGDPRAWPPMIRIGTLIGQRFEHRDRQRLRVPSAADTEIARARLGQTYDGDIVGRTPRFVVMRLENGDYILHAHRQLTVDSASLPARVLIAYPPELNGMGQASLPVARILPAEPGQVYTGQVLAHGPEGVLQRCVDGQLIRHAKVAMRHEKLQAGDWVKIRYPQQLRIGLLCERITESAFSKSGLREAAASKREMER